MDFDRILILAKKLKLPEDDIETIAEYLEHGEWGIAYEVLCSAIEQDKIVITHQIYLQIKAMGEYMRMDEDLWKVLEI